MNISREKKGMFLALGGFSFFSIGDLFIKFLADDGFSPVEIAFFINMFYLPFLLLLSPFIGGVKATLRTEKLWLHVLRSLLGVATFIINVHAFQVLGLSLTYTLMFIAPFISALIAAIYLKVPLRPHRMLTIFAGFVGVLIVLRPGFVTMDWAAYGVLCGAILIATNHVLARKIGEDEPLMAFSLFGCVIGLQVYGALSFWDGEARLPIGKDWLLYFTIASFHIVGILMTSKALSSTDTVLVAPFHYVQLLWGTVFGVLIFSTVPDIWTGIGASIIVGSGIYLIYREHILKIPLTTGTMSQGALEQDMGNTTETNKED